MKIRLTQIDGKLPNLALMKLAAYYRTLGATSDDLLLTKKIDRHFLEPQYDHVYGSAIFNFSRDRVEKFKSQFPEAVIGGTFDILNNQTVEQHLGIPETEKYDYSIYPEFAASIGFTQRGCRLKCGFCVVPKKEGKARSVNTIADIWRGEPYPKHLHLLDNDFFGQPREQWEARIEEIKSGGFKVCLNQGINTRMIDEDSAAALASIPYYDDSFTTRRLYTAWDNIGDEKRFFDGVETLAKHGIPPTHLFAYMLVGYDKKETWGRLLYRFNRMVEIGVKPFPMIYGDRHRTVPLGDTNLRIGHRTLNEFQRWAVRRYYTVCSFEEFDTKKKGAKRGEKITEIQQEILF